MDRYYIGKIYGGDFTNICGLPEYMKFKPQKQFMVSSIEQNSLSLASSLLRIESFVRFLEELRTPKFTFEIVWPLVVCYIFHKLISSIIKLNNMKYMKSFHNSKLRVKGKWDLPFWELQSLQLRECETLLWIVGYFDVMTNEFMTTIASPGNLHSIVFLHILTG